MRRLLATIQFRSGGYLSPTVTVLMAINVLVFLGGLVSGGQLIDLFAVARDPVLNGEIWRLLSAGFSHHAPMHLLFNCLALGFFGHIVEARLGSRGFAALCLLSIILGNSAHIALEPRVAAIGFSGASFAALTAFATIAPQARVIFVIFPMPAWLLVSLLICLDLFGMFNPGSGIAHAVHLIGAVCGFIAIRQQRRFTGISNRLLAIWRRRRAIRADEAAAFERRELDRLLEKVSTEGLPALTREERLFLDRYAKRHGDS
ncbi:MAG: rhomboid family intramembrane serine protease [Planctomycetota bacterium]|jgi:membrane associated rhomboid family serine protease